MTKREKDLVDTVAKAQRIRSRAWKKLEKCNAELTTARHALSEFRKELK